MAAELADKHKLLGTDSYTTAGIGRIHMLSAGALQDSSGPIVERELVQLNGAIFGVECL